ncbi:hypothetical protein ANANG_G00013300 [Anguilla anguilla]|uniref:Uncharacterized protein n=1 Tax=Anguilla anguilla TaxID=7936 RepID=A0A9D3SA04_ANGAN|nr:hypothetical protein ANANG_G00013300 [Anguilla anguilla]
MQLKTPAGQTHAHYILQAADSPRYVTELNNGHHCEGQDVFYNLLKMREPSNVVCVYSMCVCVCARFVCVQYVCVCVCVHGLRVYSMCACTVCLCICFYICVCANSIFLSVPMLVFVMCV